MCSFIVIMPSVRIYNVKSHKIKENALNEKLYPNQDSLPPDVLLGSPGGQSLCASEMMVHICVSSLLKPMLQIRCQAAF